MSRFFDLIKVYRSFARLLSFSRQFLVLPTALRATLPGAIATLATLAVAPIRLYVLVVGCVVVGYYIKEV